MNDIDLVTPLMDECNRIVKQKCETFKKLLLYEWNSVIIDEQRNSKKKFTPIEESDVSISEENGSYSLKVSSYATDDQLFESVAVPNVIKKASW